MRMASAYRQVSSNCSRSTSRGRYEALRARLSEQHDARATPPRWAQIAQVLATGEVVRRHLGRLQRGRPRRWMTCVRVDGLGSLASAKVRVVLLDYFDWPEKRLA